MNPIFKSLLLSAVIGFVISSPIEFKPTDNEDVPSAAADVNYRLSRDVMPLRYDLKLTPYFENVSYWCWGFDTFCCESYFYLTIFLIKYLISVVNC